MKKEQKQASKKSEAKKHNKNGKISIDSIEIENESNDKNEVIIHAQMSTNGHDADAVDAVAKTTEEEIYLTDAEGRRLCRIRDCDQAAIVDTYCRFHYLQNWKRIQVRRKILTDGKLDFYVDELTSRYPDKFLEMIRKDLRTEKDFIAAIAELEIDESGIDQDQEDEGQEFIDEVRGVSDTGIAEDDDF